METVNFGNNGALDPRAFKTFGLNAKLNESSIGYFGTGLKYAIAVILREGRNISITSCGDDYEFSVVKTDFRGKEFDAIFCNGEEMPFTTELGKNWELWQAYRELCSNAIDEGGGRDFDGETVVSADIGDVNHNDVFIDDNKEVVFKNNLIEVRAGESNIIYHKGIKAKQTDKPTRLTYNVLSADLTEDRTFKYWVEVSAAISSYWGQMVDSRFIKFIVHQSKPYFEAKLDFDHFHGGFSEEMIEFCTKCQISGVWTQENLINKVKSVTGRGQELDKIEADQYQSGIIENALLFCRDAGYDIQYDVYLTERIGEYVLGMADRSNQTIWLSTELVDKGVKETAACLIEEYCHLKHGLDDYTSGIQDWCFKEICAQAAKRLNLAL